MWELEGVDVNKGLKRERIFVEGREKETESEMENGKERWR